MRVRSVLRRIRELRHRDDGMSTAEYAVGTVAAVAFAGILLKVVTSSSVQSALTTIITQALKA
jgi:TRAP-type uncharacterized transport system fused permease subunit